VSRVTPDLPTLLEVDQIAKLIEHVERDGTEVEGWKMSSTFLSPWVIIDVQIVMAGPTTPVTFALWRDSGAVFATHEGAVDPAESPVIGAGWKGFL
jgi:hypothetical protein